MRPAPASLVSYLLIPVLICAGQLFAQSDSVQVTFRAFAPSSPTMFVPGEFNGWGPNTNGAIAAGAPSQMVYSLNDGGWIKTYHFKIHDPSRTSLGDSVLQYKFNSGGSANGWNSDPFNPEKNANDNNNSVLRLSKLFWFEVNPVQSGGTISRVYADIPHALGDTITGITVKWGDSEAALTVDTDGVSLYDSETGLLNYPFVPGIAKSSFIILTAYNNHRDSAVYRRIGYSITVLPKPAYAKDGVTLGSSASNDSVSFLIRVPLKDYVLLRIAPIGQRPDTAAPILLRKHTDPYTWWTNLKLPAGTYEYLYEFPDGRRIYDPWGRYNGTLGSRFTVGAQGLTADDYQWHDQTWRRPPLNRLAIYELNLAEAVGGYYNWNNTHPKNFTDLIGLLPYYDSLGINAIELMPVNDYGSVGASGFSWGYDLNSDLALEPGLGTPRDFKTLVDSAHARGMAIIMDVVLNHLNDTGPLWAMQPDVSTNPYFHNPGTNKNEDGLTFFKDLNHWAPETQQYAYAALKQWIDVYHVDGFRYDFTRGIGWDNTNPNVGILGWANKIDQDYGGAIYQTAEHLPDSPTLIKLSGLTSGWHDAFHDLVYSEATNHSTSLDNFEKYVLDTYTFQSVDVPNLYDHYDDRTGPVQIGVDHDEWSWVHGMINQAGVSLDEARKRDKLYATFIFTSLGVPFLWEGMEHGEDRGWTNDGQKLSYRPVQWSLGTTVEGQSHFGYYQSLVFQRLHNPALYRGTLRKLYKYVSQKSLVWGFEDTSSTAKVMAAVNLTGSTQVLHNVPWLAAGAWYDIQDQSAFSAPGTTLDSLVIPAFTARVFSNKSKEMLLPVHGGDPEIPTAYQLEQNYPNPFNPATTIRFSLPERSQVSLTVYDVLGREVATLVRGELPAGNHEVSFATARVASGVYLYRLTTPGYTAVRKMILAK